MPGNDAENNKIIVVGAGLVGSLSAVYFANRGLTVEIYERNPDPRLEGSNLVRKSINLALSCRGLSALENSGFNVLEFLQENALPMKGRLLHYTKGNESVQLYGLSGQAINSIDRSLLNKVLLERAEKMSNVSIFFEHKLESCNFDQNTCVFTYKEDKKYIKGGLVVGADGSYSKVRAEMMKITKSNFSQYFIDHGYCELSIPARTREDGTPDYKMDPNYLHIWPRGSYMMIALPNLDHSFTCTLFMPFSQFEKIKDEQSLIDFFTESLPDSIPLIGRDNLIKEYFSNPKSSLVTTKVYPLNYKNKSILLGDSSHSMVPFYGQGMNAGFEDVNLLFKCFDEHNVIDKKSINHKQLQVALDHFNEKRYPDILAICDLAMQNYVEMRSTVNSLGYVLKRKLMLILHSVLPRLVIPLYSMVSFTNIPYSQIITKNARQTRLIDSLLYFGSLVGIGCSCFAFRRYNLIDFTRIYRRMNQLNG